MQLINQTHFYRCPNVPFLVHLELDVKLHAGLVQKHRVQVGAQQDQVQVEEHHLGVVDLVAPEDLVAAQVDLVGDQAAKEVPVVAQEVPVVAQQVPVVAEEDPGVAKQVQAVDQ